MNLITELMLKDFSSFALKLQTKDEQGQAAEQVSMADKPQKNVQFPVLSQAVSLYICNFICICMYKYKQEEESLNVENFNASEEEKGGK